MHKDLMAFIVGFSIIIILAGTYFIGAAVSCNNSNGTLLGGFNLIKLKCNNIDVIEVCEYQDKYYIKRNVTQNFSINLQGS